MYLDTQILSYKFKGNEKYYTGSIKDKYISSVVACEFLYVFIKNDCSNSRYYPFYNHLLNGMISSNGVFESKKHCAQGKHRTDKIILDFNNKYSNIVLYGSESLSRLINERSRKGILLSTEHLDKKLKKGISSRIDFLFDHNIKVTPLNDRILNNMFEIMSSIEKTYNFKNDFRNSVMDLLIASTSLTENSGLVTVDKELNRVLCNEFELPFTKESEVLKINQIAKSVEADKFIRIESKNYINRGWQYRINKFGPSV